MKSITSTARVLLIMQQIMLLSVSNLSPSTALLICPVHTKRHNVPIKSFTKCWSLPEQQDEDDSSSSLTLLDTKTPQDDDDDSNIENNNNNILGSSSNNIQTSDKDDDNMLGSFSFLSSLNNIDFLEVRLDATLCAIFVLGRFLLYDMTLPRKEIPGMEITDVVAVLDTFSSAGALAILWSIAGIGMGLFDDDETSSNNNDDDDVSLLTRLFGTTAFSVPLWILLEKLCHWPISAGLDDGTSLLQAMFLSSLDVLGTMLIGRTISRFLP